MVVLLPVHQQVTGSMLQIVRGSGPTGEGPTCYWARLVAIVQKKVECGPRAFSQIVRGSGPIGEGPKYDLTHAQRRQGSRPTGEGPTCYRAGVVAHCAKKVKCGPCITRHVIYDNY
jgi:hypothetical protein